MGGFPGISELPAYAPVAELRPGARIDGRAGDAQTASHYYFQIDAVRREGEPIPLERLRGTIRRILFNQRQSEIIRSHEEELYNRACEGGSIKIFENENTNDKEKE